MFGRMEEQTEDVAGEVSAANRPRGEELVLRNLFQAAYRVIECHVDKGKQLLGSRWWRAGVSLSTHSDELVIPDRLSPGIGEEPVHAPADVSQMEAHRSGPAGALPQLDCCERLGGFVQIFSGLQQGVRHRH
jgi:hypothetical protein